MIQYDAFVTLLEADKLISRVRDSIDSQHDKALLKIARTKIEEVQTKLFKDAIDEKKREISGDV